MGKWLPMDESCDPAEPGILWRYYPDNAEGGGGGDDFIAEEVRPYPKDYFRQ